ncbi:uncharacterized protein BN659_00736 [Bacteroides sp. CAG:443]|uniref:porin family protein n=1 Tax=Phocaeicola sp. TaxID=2773926 RepID=UPI000336E339|nr:uncharacterized protein BN659_00736 [Bacteroides sp. CAG:443]
MKKQSIIALLSFLCLSAGIPVHAQLQDPRHNLAIGINGGVNLSSVSFEPSIKEKTFLTPSFGVTIRYISERYLKMFCGIQAEINYSQRGWKENIDDGTGDTYQRSMNYVEVPLMAHLAFGKDKGYGARFVLNLGPQIGYLLGESEKKSEAWHPNERPSGVIWQYGKMAESKFDYGIVGGVGIEARTGIGNFLLEARYYFGLSDFYHSTKKDPFSRSAHSYIAGRLTYLFDLKK